jgi:putative ABC transport system permease protein
VTRRRPNLDDLDQEIRDHIDAETRDNVERGMAVDDARDAAIRKFGNLTRVKEEVREVWVAAWWDAGRQDTRDAIRRLRRNPGFAVAIAVTLALGIGLTTAIFSVVNAVLLRPLSYPHPERVVWLTTRGAESSTEILNGLDFADWRARATTFERMVAYAFSDSTVVTGGEASRWRIMLASDGFWDLSGARATLGALPAATDRQVLVISHRTFRQRFESDPRVIGRAVTINGRQYTIAAVLAEDFAPQLPEWFWRPGLDRLEVDAYQGLMTPVPPRGHDPNQMAPIYLALGQLKPGVRIEQARAELESIHGRIQQEYSTPFGPSSAVLVPLDEKLVGPSRRALRILLAAALVVLLITCANVASLLWSRSAVRQKETALRMAVGSGPLRVVRQLLAESVGYALLGGAGGVLLAWWLVTVIVGIAGEAVPRLTEASVDFRVLGFATVISVLTALMFGIGPALSLGHSHVQEVLKDGARGASASRRVRAAGRVAVGVQLALTVVLVTGAGLMLKSVWRMTSYPAGFTPAEILTLRMEFSGPAYRDNPAARHAYTEALLTRARSLPGIRRAELTTGRESITLVIKEGEPLPEDREARTAPVSAVSPGFASMLGMSLVHGRWLENLEPPGALLVNEALVRRDFPNTDPLGARIRHPELDEGQYGTIVGIVRDLKYLRIDAEAEPELFMHYRDARPAGVTLALHLEGNPLEAAPAITKALAAVDPTQSIFSVKTLEQMLADSIAPRRFNLLLLGTFALVATVLAALGVYGVVAYAVAERTHEIGIRLALGAERSHVVRMIVQQGMVSVVTGIAMGVAGALAASRLIAGLLYGVAATDAPTFAMTTLALMVIACVACVAPAVRAAFIEPSVALRSE